jgi:hypothetical protein
MQQGFLLCIITAPPGSIQSAFKFVGASITGQSGAEPVIRPQSVPNPREGWMSDSDRQAFAREFRQAVDAQLCAKPGLSPEQEKALVNFAAKYGRRWKSQLNYKWMSGHDCSEEGGNYLRQIRNEFGPAWLTKYRLPERSLDRDGGMEP